MCGLRQIAVSWHIFFYCTQIWVYEAKGAKYYWRQTPLGILIYPHELLSTYEVLSFLQCSWWRLRSFQPFQVMSTETVTHVTRGSTAFFVTVNQSTEVYLFQNVWIPPPAPPPHTQKNGYWILYATKTSWLIWKTRYKDSQNSSWNVSTLLVWHCIQDVITHLFKFYQLARLRSTKLHVTLHTTSWKTCGR